MSEHYDKPDMIGVEIAWDGSARRGRLLSNWATIVKRVKCRDGYRCTMVYEIGGRCTQLGTDVDHIVPGDDHSDDNLRLLCRWCHARKSGQEGAVAAARSRVRTERPSTTHPALED
ncbi:HNH endonuclease [Streptomyces sp. NPDC048506]|uniref:HNH endonuclease n=1 Tax=Streptomyces sp. NPDC048506 TaxID=3155028 RepID=UPI00341D48BE